MVLGWAQAGLSVGFFSSMVTWLVWIMPAFTSVEPECVSLCVLEGEQEGKRREGTEGLSLSGVKCSFSTCLAFGHGAYVMCVGVSGV